MGVYSLILLAHVPVELVGNYSKHTSSQLRPLDFWYAGKVTFSMMKLRSHFVHIEMRRNSGFIVVLMLQASFLNCCKQSSCSLCKSISDTQLDLSMYNVLSSVQSCPRNFLRLSGLVYAGKRILVDVR